MEKIHISSPEAEVFLRLAARSASDFIRVHGRCPQRWSDMDITYANGPYRVTDPDVRPLPENGQSWRPRNSNYEYVLKVGSNDQTCRILALKDGRQTELYIEPGMEEPRSPN